MLLSYLFSLVFGLFFFLYIPWKFIRNLVLSCLQKFNRESLTYFTHASLYRYFLDIYYPSSLALHRLLHIAQ